MEVNYKELAKEARIAVLGMIHKAGTSHIASNFSCIDIASVLYPSLGKEDKVIWSKGWAAASIYYFNAKYGLGPKEAVDKFPQEPFFGLAETTVEGVYVNGGSVGHGLGVAVGMAYAKKLKGEEGTIYCIMSDGELNEGSVWEAVMFASHHGLNNIIAIIDENGWQAMGKTEDVLNINPQKVFQAFGWGAVKCDGHNFIQLFTYIDTPPDGSPLCIVAKTIKGKGVSMFEDKLLFHYKNIDDETYQKALTELQNA